MIIIQEGLKVGDSVYFWASPYKESQNKKSDLPNEREYKIKCISPDTLGLTSVMGGYDMIFTKELIDSWFGNCRRM